MIRRILVLFALLFLVFPPIVHSAEVLSIADFESSTFYKKYSVQKKDVWKLRSGGKNFHYTYQDFENLYSGFGLELSSDPSNIKSIAVEWHGKSIYHPARLTKVREQFLRDLLLVVEPTVDPDTVVAYVKSQQVNDYPGGGNTMPRKQLGKAAIYAGTVGEGLIVGIDRLSFLMNYGPSGGAIHVDLLAGMLNDRPFTEYTLDDITTSFGRPDHQEEEQYLSSSQETLGPRLDYTKYGVTFWFASFGTDPARHLVEISIKLQSSDRFPVAYTGGLNPAGSATTKQKEILANIEGAGIDIGKAVINERIVNLTFQDHWVRWFFKPHSGFLYGISMHAERI